MNQYSALNIQEYRIGEYAIVPIRMEDRHLIRKWRNEQIYHLRQSKPLTEEDQDRYFDTVVSTLFEQKQPSQILFSYLHKNECIGYGGLVHINWRDRNGEISFLIDTERNTKENYSTLFEVFLELIEQAALEAQLFKIYTYGYVIAEYRFKPLERKGYVLEAVLRNHVLVEENLCDVKIYGKLIEKRD